MKRIIIVVCSIVMICSLAPTFSFQGEGPVSLSEGSPELAQHETKAINQLSEHFETLNRQYEEYKKQELAIQQEGRQSYSEVWEEQVARIYQDKTKLELLKEEINSFLKDSSEAVRTNIMHERKLDEKINLLTMGYDELYQDAFTDPAKNVEKYSKDLAEKVKPEIESFEVTIKNLTNQLREAYESKKLTEQITKVDRPQRGMFQKFADQLHEWGLRIKLAFERVIDPKSSIKTAQRLSDLYERIGEDLKAISYDAKAAEFAKKFESEAAAATKRLARSFRIFESMSATQKAQYQLHVANAILGVYQLEAELIAQDYNKIFQEKYLSDLKYDHIEPFLEGEKLNKAVEAFSPLVNQLRQLNLSETQIENMIDQLSFEGHAVSKKFVVEEAEPQSFAQRVKQEVKKTLKP